MKYTERKLFLMLCGSENEDKNKEKKKKKKKKSKTKQEQQFFDLKYNESLRSYSLPFNSKKLKQVTALLWFYSLNSKHCSDSIKWVFLYVF